MNLKFTTQLKLKQLTLCLKNVKQRDVEKLPEECALADVGKFKIII